MAEFENVALPKLESMAKEDKIDGLILVSGKPNNFIAGADIDMILATKNASEAEALSREGHRMMNRWEDLPFDRRGGQRNVFGRGLRAVVGEHGDRDVG